MVDQPVLLSIDKIKDKYEHALPPWGPVGYVTYKRTYSRATMNRTEEWWETCLRCVNGAQVIKKDLFTEMELYELYDHLFQMKGLFSGRALWQLGTKMVNKGIPDNLVNCWAVTPNDYKSFCFLFEELMLGGGVGFSVRAEDVYQLPKVKSGVKIKREDSNDSDFIVPDSREGWVSLLRKLLKAFFVTGRSFTYSLHCLRSAGSPIKGFGGIASGPVFLEQMVDKMSTILKHRAGTRLRSEDVLDICNIAGETVVSGNIRRSAELALGDATDIKFLQAKRWDLGNVPNWRAMSNNTVYCEDFNALPKEFWDTYEVAGEPYGLFNLKLAQSKGVLREDRIDKGNMLNPCGETVLESYEPCNLAELALPRLGGSVKEASRVAQLLFRFAKAVTCMNWLWPETQEVVQRNRRIGISITGYLQHHGFSDDQLYEIYKSLREYDKWISGEWKIPESIRITVTQPAGSKSLLYGALPGVHPAYAEFYIRRIRISSSSPLIEQAREKGYHIEHQIGFDGAIDYRTMVVEFPVKAPIGAKLAKDMTAIDQLEAQKRLQTYWSDQAVSCTVYYKRDELKDIKKWLAENFESSVKSVSFLLHQDHGFIQAPYEEITKEKYEELIAKTTPFTNVTGNTTEDVLEENCTGGACPLR